VPIHCLVVDDNPEFIETVRQVPGRQGIGVLGVTADSAEATEFVSKTDLPGDRDPNCVRPEAWQRDRGPRVDASKVPA